MNNKITIDILCLNELPLWCYSEFEMSYMEECSSFTINGLHYYVTIDIEEPDALDLFIEHMI